MCVYVVFSKYLTKNQQRKPNKRKQIQTPSLNQQNIKVCVCVCVCVWSANTTNKILLDSHEKKTNVMYFFLSQIYANLLFCWLCVWMLNAVLVLSSKLRRASTGDGMFSKLFVCNACDANCGTQTAKAHVSVLEYLQWGFSRNIGFGHFASWNGAFEF